MDLLFIDRFIKCHETLSVNLEVVWAEEVDEFACEAVFWDQIELVLHLFDTACNEFLLMLFNDFLEVPTAEEKTSL